MKENVYDSAKSGGDYSKFYESYKIKYTKQLTKAARSYQKVIDQHKAWITDPSIKLGDNCPVEIVEQNRLKWQEDIRRNSAYKSIVEGILKEKKNG